MSNLRHIEQAAVSEVKESIINAYEIKTGMMLGYLKTADGEYEINEEEAEIVRRIYREYLSGLTVTRICRGLEADGIATKLGKTRWQHSVIVSILSNEKYTGKWAFFCFSLIAFRNSTRLSRKS